MNILDVKQFHIKLRNMTVKELWDKELLEEISRLFVSLSNTLNIVNPKRKPLIIREK